MIDHFIELINDETDPETAAEIAYSSDPNPTALLTRGEAASELAKVMQYGVYATADIEAENLVLREEVADQKRQLEAMQRAVDAMLSKVTNLTRVMHTKGLLMDLDLDLPDTVPHVRDKEDVPHEDAIPDFYGPGNSL